MVPTKSFWSKDNDTDAPLSQMTGKVLLLSRLPKSAQGSIMLALMLSRVVQKASDARC
jgi:hypothetical protein